LREKSEICSESFKIGSRWKLAYGAMDSFITPYISTSPANQVKRAERSISTIGNPCYWRIQYKKPDVTPLPAILGFMQHS
jgi:hypothetical protein